ncbi:MAG: hypothetical protein ACKON9_21150 [Planctomycetaceae bacterium]
MSPNRTANLFLACTPLQILNAAEARDRFHPHDDNFLVVFHSPRSAKKQTRLAELSADAIDQRWTQTWNLRLSRLSQLLFPFTARKLQQQIGPCHSLWTGGFQTQQRHLINSFPHQQLFVFDGGAGVLQSAVNSWRNQSSARRSLKQFIPGQNTRLPDLSRARFFTSYALDMPPESIITNDYRIFRQQVSAKLPVRDEIVFLSQPLQRDLGLNLDVAATVAAAMQHHNASRCRFILHPRETSGPPNAEKLPYLADFFGLRDGYLPKAFVTWMSSVARSLPAIYGRPVTCFDIRPLMPPETPPDYLRELQATYEDFAAAGAIILPQPASRLSCQISTTAHESSAA